MMRAVTLTINAFIPPPAMRLESVTPTLYAMPAHGSATVPTASRTATRPERIAEAAAVHAQCAGTARTSICTSTGATSLRSSASAQRARTERKPLSGTATRASPLINTPTKGTTTTGGRLPMPQRTYVPGYRSSALIQLHIR